MTDTPPTPAATTAATKKSPGAPRGRRPGVHPPAGTRPNPAALARRLSISPTPRQTAFCEEYLKDFNKLGAYLRAGYSAKNAKVEAYKLFNQPSIQSILKRLTAERAKKNEITVHSVIASLHRIAESAENEGKFAAAIRSFELLGKHLGMFVDKTETTLKHQVAADPASVEAEIKRLINVAFGESDEPTPEAAKCQK